MTTILFLHPAPEQIIKRDRDRDRDRERETETDRERDRDRESVPEIDIKFLACV